jgi:hypothetical protein
MADETHPLLRLLPPRTLSRKKRKPAFPPPPQRVPQRHAQGLRRGADLVRQHLAEAARKFPQLATDVPYVRIKLAPGVIASDDELKSVGLIPVYRREDSVLAAYSPEREMRTLGSQLDSYAQLKKKLAALSKIDAISPWSREDRMSSRLRAISIEAGQEYTVDLLLLPIEGHPANPQAVPAIERFLASQQGRVVDRAVEPTFTALRIRAGGQTLNSLLDYRDDIALVDLPPAAHVLVPQVLSLDLDALPETAPPPAAAPALCVVDSGILEGHPLLEPAILADRSRSFPADLGPPIPAAPVGEARHGTQVAGIALYGDVGSCAVAKEVRAGSLVGERPHPRRQEPVASRSHAVRARRRSARPGSLPRLQHVVRLEPSDGFLSVHAAELDALTREHNVLFVVSAGNEDAATHFNSGRLKKKYPEYLIESGWRVLSPAEGLNVLTVGGVTPDRDPYPHQRIGVAPKRAPSPFSRAGALKNVVKPELVELAGNLAFDQALKRWVDNDPGLRVPTTSDRFAEGQLLGFVHGTSFAAPKVAHAAALILDRYPEASPNLARALLVQSARPPEGVADWDPKHVLRTCGFGVPDLDRAIYCRPQRVTLYYEGEIEVGEVKLFEIPVPKELSAAKGRKSLSVSLAYDPPVSVVHRDRPAGIYLTWELARGDVPESAVQAAIAAEAEMDVDAAPSAEVEAKAKKVKRVFMKGILPKRLQQRGTVQKNVFQWRRGEHGDTYRLAVTAKATRPAHADDRQRFAVVATLECEDADVNVYTAVRTRLAAGRVRVRVKAE